MFRWKGIIFLAVLAAVFVALSLIFTDRWLEGKLENAGSSIAGAKVEIDNLDLSFIKMKLRWQRLQVTDSKNTWKNIFETGMCDFDLEFWPLLSKKFIVENFQISGFRTYTDRKTDGKIPRPPKSAEKSEPGVVGKTMTKLTDAAGSAAQTQAVSYKQKVNVDSILALLNIQSIKKIDSLKTDLTAKYQNWDARFAKLDVENSAKDIEGKIKTIDLNKIKTVEQLQTALDNANDIKKSVESLTNNLQTTKRDLLSDLNLARSVFGHVDDWIKDDYERARALAKLPEFSAQNIGKLIFGPGLVYQVNHYLGYVETARAYAGKLKSGEPAKEENPPRLKGQNIYFYNPHARPDFWIKQISLSGETNDGMLLEGQIHHIVSDQKFINKPTDFSIHAGKEQAAQFDLNGVFNYLGAEGVEQFKASYVGFSMAHTKLSDSPFLPNQLEKGSGAVYASLDLQGERLNSEIKFVASNLLFDFGAQAQTKNYFEKIVQDIVRQINEINLIAKIQSEKGDVKVNINSNLDDLFMTNLKNVLSAEVEKAKQKIKERIDKETAKYRAELDKFIRDKETQFNAQLKKYEDVVSAQLAQVDVKKKEIEKKIEDEKKKLGKDAGKQLKKLLK